MAQTTGQTLLVDEARLEDNVTSVNPCPDHEKLGDEVEASTAEIHGYLQKYATIERLDLPLTQQLQILQRKLRDQFPHLDTLRTYGGSVADRNDCDELEQWVTTCEKDSKQLGGISGSKGDKVPNQACGGWEDLATDLTGSNVMLQETEAMTSSMTGLDKILSTTDKLTPTRVDEEERPEEVTLFYDDTVELIM